MDISFEQWQYFLDNFYKPDGLESQIQPGEILKSKALQLEEYLIVQIQEMIEKSFEFGGRQEMAGNIDDMFTKLTTFVKKSTTDLMDKKEKHKICRTLSN